ncbi:DNA-directed DNA polymerase [Bacteriovorax sp. BSW11_IV]|uniref:DNA polymerase I n=1 Tax=Bacteriovorax sp. BSW11_IV TaxID=1353529 RepID=UPI00038A15A0|nr:DNA polymerase I [Bacteriovorax sp. BSW11_IV]EQC48315.1 DNA-directed DNA polymerase [Bacteriovorax sp. BSW11_IV]
MPSPSRLIIIDVSNFIFRAFYAIRPLHAPDGTPVNAVHGILSMFMKMFSVYRPTHILLARDTKGGSFRNQIYDAYKANRSEPPEDLIPQFDLIAKLIEKMELKYAMNEEYEADDIIGSACVQWKDKFDEILIASGDKDLMQFVEGNTKVLDTMKDKIFGPADVFEKMGVRPDQIVDYLSIVGDTSDNVPGMKGIGAKGAAKLLEEYGTLENCIANKDNLKGKKLITAFTDYLDQGLLSKKLVQIVTDVDLHLQPEDTAYKFYPTDDLISYLESLGFKSMLVKLKEIKYQVHQAENQKTESTPSFSVSASSSEEVEAVVSKSEFITISSKEEFSDILNKISSHESVALHTEYDSEDKLQREILAAAITLDEEKTYYVPFYNNTFSKDDLIELLTTVFCNENLEVFSEHSKLDYIYSLVSKIEFKAKMFDIVQAHFILNTGGNHSIENLAGGMGIQLPSFDKKNQHISDIEADLARDFTCARADATWHLATKYKAELAKVELESIYYDIDAKLISVLAAMETEGVRINAEYFKKFESELSTELESIQNKINRHSEKEVNLNSPKQVGEFLFEELALPVVKKTKTGFSTDSEVLEDLASRNISEVPALILQFRELGKILSTYVKAIPQLASEVDGKIHTSFNQHVAQTGRLSSVNPNLQNIPIRSEMGRKVRKGFIATPGNLLLSADYSQVELRLLAHFSEDPVMLKAFQEGADIHAQTASEVLGIPLDKVTSNDRAKAKAVNFGLMYGQSSFGLAKALGISRKDAKDFIDVYFERFSAVKGYLDSLKEKAEAYGYTITYHGRKRFLPDIHSQNRTIKANAERMAINSPIQGTAADIIKIAMINIDQSMKDAGLKSKMLLQVHDELIFEVIESELEQMKQIVRTGMETVVDLKVPLRVDMGIGVNWYDLK